MSAKLTCIFYSPSKELFLSPKSVPTSPSPPPVPAPASTTTRKLISNEVLLSQKLHEPWLSRPPLSLPKMSLAPYPQANSAFRYSFFFFFKLFDWLVVARILDGIWRGNHKRWKSWKTFERFWWKFGNICYDFRLSHVSPELEVHLGSAIILCKIVVFNLGDRVLKFGLFEIF